MYQSNFTAKLGYPRIHSQNALGPWAPSLLNSHCPPHIFWLQGQSEIVLFIGKHKAHLRRTKRVSPDCLQLFPSRDCLGWTLPSEALSRLPRVWRQKWKGSLPTALKLFRKKTARQTFLPSSKLWSESWLNGEFQLFFFFLIPTFLRPPHCC